MDYWFIRMKFSFPPISWMVLPAICSVLFYKYSIPPGWSCAGFASLSFLFIRGITYGPEKKSNYWNWGMPFGQPDISAPWQRKKRKGYISGACSDSLTFRFRTIPVIGSGNSVWGGVLISFLPGYGINTFLIGRTVKIKVVRFSVIFPKTIIIMYRLPVCRWV